MRTSRSVTNSSRLERRAGEIAVAFGGTWSGAKGMCRCPAHDDRSPSLAIFGIACWTTLGNERFGLVTIPQGVRELTLFIDADAGGELAEQWGRAAYAREGRIIVTQRPAIQGQDWNDVVAERSGSRNDQTLEERVLEAD